LVPADPDCPDEPLRDPRATAGGANLTPKKTGTWKGGTTGVRATGWQFATGVEGDRAAGAVFHTHKANAQGIEPSCL